jgi:hypothetical protein
MEHEIRELEDRWIFALRSNRVTGIEWGDASVVFRLDVPGEITVGYNALFAQGKLVDPLFERVPLHASDRDKVERCVGSKIASAVGFKDGAMRVVFLTGQQLSVRSGEPFVPAALRLEHAVVWERIEGDGAQLRVLGQVGPSEG